MPIIYRSTKGSPLTYEELDGNFQFFTASINAISGAYATTGSNNFIGNQIFQGNISVLGTASFTYTTSSVNTISASSFNIAVSSPTVRYGFYNVIDSGSYKTTSSLAWDSTNQRWIYQKVTGSITSSAVLLTGPISTEGLGTETNIPQYVIPISNGTQSLASSNIYSSGSIHIVTGSLTVTQGITGSLLGTASFALTASNYLLLSNTGSFATTGSNSFNGNQIITGSLTVTQGITGSYYIGTTVLNLSRSSAPQNLTGVNIDGNAITAGTAGTVLNTNLGFTAIGVITFNSASEYSKPAGYQGYLVNSSTGLPAGVSGWLAYNVVGKRDVDSGTYATLIDQIGNMWFGFATTSSVYPTWTKIQTVDAFNAISSSFTTTSSFNSFTQSYYSDSASFDTRIKNITFDTSSLVTTSSFNTYTSSINNATSSFTTTSSFNSYTSSVNSSLLNKASLTGENTFSEQNLFTGGNSDRSSVKFVGYNQRGGTGYHGYYEVENTYSSATNPKKFFRIDDVGSWEIGNNSGTTILSLTDAGVITTDGGGTSDLRTKNNIEYINSDISSIINQLRPIKFEFKTSPGKIRHGFIAQDVLEIKPDLVLGDGDKENGTYGLDYDGILALTVKALQESNKKIFELETMIKELQNKIK
jgi:hypothetical protein